MASEHIPVYVLGRFLVSETVGCSETSKNCILNWFVSEFLTSMAYSPSSLCSCGL